jgi:hypothetical protein
MQLRTATLLLLACLTANLAVAQKNKKKPNKDVEVINFGDENDDAKKEEKAYLGLILKTSPTAFIFGRQPIELEKEINEYLSLQAGVGVTFEPLWTSFEDILAELRESGDGYCDSPQWAYDECDYYNDYTIREGKVGFMASVSPRLFFDSDGYEGMYIAPVLRYSTQKFEVQKIREGVNYIERIPSDVQEESVKNFDLLVHYGGQSLYPKLSVEWFIGAGIRFRDNFRQDVGYQGTFQLSANGSRSFKDKKFRLESGIRVGFQL